MGSGTILVVDDESHVRLLNKTVLERAGYSVVTAADGQEAIDVCRSRTGEIALVLMDMRLPMRKLPVIISSGLDRREVSADMPDDQNLVIVQKPCRSADLLEKVESFLGA